MNSKKNQEEENSRISKTKLINYPLQYLIC